MTLNECMSDKTIQEFMRKCESSKDGLPPVSILENRIDTLVDKHGGYRQCADVLGIDSGYLCKVRNGQKPASDRLLKKLGLKRTVTIEDDSI